MLQSNILGIIHFCNQLLCILLGVGPSLSSIPWYQYSLLLCCCFSSVFALCVSWYQGMAWEPAVSREWKKTRLVLRLGRQFWHFFKKIDILWPSSFKRMMSWKCQCLGSILFLSVSVTVSWFFSHLRTVFGWGQLLGKNAENRQFCFPYCSSKAAPTEKILYTMTKPTENAAR